MTNLTFYKVSFWGLILMGAMFFACKSDKKGAMTAKTTPEMLTLAGDSYAMLNQESLRPGEVTSMRKVANDILAHRIKESGSKSYTIVDKDIWVYDGVVKNSKMTMADSLGGRWIDFKENLTYEYGRYDKKEGQGRYTYDLEKGTLLMMDDNEAIKPQEFEVKLRDDMMVIVGLYTYEDNNMQAKLTRHPSYPSRAAGK